MNNQTQKNIPDGWHEVKLADLGVFSKGAGILKDEVLDSGNNAVRYGEIYTRYDFKIKKIHSFISDEVAAGSKKIKYGDIVFAGSGETADEIGKSAAYLLHEDCYAGGDTIIFTPENADSLFLSFFLNVGEARKRLRELGQGQSVVHVYKGDLENVKLHIPMIAEQRRIVSVVEAWDRTIERLSRKIDIKKNVKKELMRQLLSGDLRLSGFTEEWLTIKLGEVCKIKRGDMITKNVISSGKIPVIAGGKQPAYYHNRFNYDGKTITVSGSGASAGFINYFQCPIFASDCSIVKGMENKADTDFIYYQLLNRQEYIYSLQSGGAQPHIYPKDLALLKIHIPHLNEQIKLANIFSIVDKEIAKLEKMLLIIRNQKKYLLNNLITGKIRTQNI